MFIQIMTGGSWSGRWKVDMAGVNVTIGGEGELREEGRRFQRVTETDKFINYK